MTVAHRRRFFSSSSGSGPGVKLFIRSGQEDIRYLRALVPLHPHPLPTHSSGFGHGGSGYWHADRDKNLVQLLYDSGSSSSSSLSSSSMYLSSSMSFLSLLWFSCIFRHSPTFHVVSKIYDVFGTQFHQGGGGVWGPMSFGITGTVRIPFLYCPSENQVVTGCKSCSWSASDWEDASICWSSHSHQILATFPSAFNILI